MDDNTLQTSETTELQEQKYVRFGEQMAFNLSAMFRDMSYAIFGQFHIFCIEILRIPPLNMAWLQLSQRLWDGVNDPLVGAYFDRRPFDREKARRYFLPTAFPLAILLVLMFTPLATMFPGLSGAQNLMWLQFGFILLLYLPFDPLHSLNGTAFMSYYNSISPNLQERNGIIARSRMFSTFGSAIVGGGIPLFFSWFSEGAGDTEGRTRVFIILAITVAVAFVVYNVLMHTKVRERIVSPPQEQKQSFRSVFRSLFSNKLFFILVAANTIQGIINRGNTDFWLFQYNIGDTAWQTYLGLIAGLPAMLLATWLMPKLCNYFEKRDIIIGAAIMRIVVRGLYLFIGSRPGMFNLTGAVAAQNLFSAKAFMGVVFFLNELPNATRGQLYWSMLADSVDYQEWKSNKRNDGTVYTMEGLMGKIVGSIGAMATGVILNFIGFDQENMEYQSAATMRGLFTVPLSIELVSIAASTAPFFFYNLKRDDHAKMIEELKARAAAAKAAEISATL